MFFKLMIILAFAVVVLGRYVYKQQNIKALNYDEAAVNSDFNLKTVTLDMEKLKSYCIPMLIDFGADSCVPSKSKEMAPVLKKFNKKYHDRVIIKFVDVRRNPELAENFSL